MYVLLNESEGLRVTSVAAFRRENIRPVSFEVNDNISDTLVIIIDHNQIRFVSNEQDYLLCITYKERLYLVV